VADINGTVCRYIRDDNQLILALYGREGMTKVPREESETSDNKEDIDRDTHVPLAKLQVEIKETRHLVHVDYAAALEEGKGYSKLLYLKLAKWCRNNGFKKITGTITNKEALPLYVRYKIPNSVTHIALTSYNAHHTKINKKKLTRMKVKFHETPDYLVIDEKLSDNELKHLVPFYAVTELL
jgi:GNAT superfamily N-acetyltransferase